MIISFHCTWDQLVPAKPLRQRLISCTLIWKEDFKSGSLPHSLMSIVMDDSKKAWGGHFKWLCGQNRSVRYSDTLFLSESMILLRWSYFVLYIYNSIEWQMIMLYGPLKKKTLQCCCLLKDCNSPARFYCAGTEVLWVGKHTYCKCSYSSLLLLEAVNNIGFYAEYIGFTTPSPDL